MRNDKHPTRLRAAAAPAPSPWRPLFATAAAITFLSLGALGGCAGPSKANIELRKQNQQLQAKIDQLQLAHNADQASIRALQAKWPTTRTLPQSELDQLFTTAGLRLGSLTGGYHPDPQKSGDTELRIYVVPIDESGDPIKAAGAFRVELFDLALKTGNRIGQWDFDLTAARDSWRAQLYFYTYILQCPWQIAPVHAQLLARVTFTDALTHRVFTVDRDVTVQPPPTASP